MCFGSKTVINKEVPTEAGTLIDRQDECLSKTWISSGLETNTQYIYTKLDNYKIQLMETQATLYIPASV